MIELYIGDKKVDLSENIDILFNWELTDLNNPLLIKNQGYSKTVVLDGTNNNNAIFGHFWDLERYQNYGGTTGVNFNPSYRVPFTLYYNSSIYESGYVKLQRVITKNGVHQYEVGLFGGLGGFFYNLQTDWNTGEKKTLADLKYYANSASTQEVDLSFTINRDAVYNAWSGDILSSIINFAPTYYGYPDNLDADKVLINFNNMPLANASGDCSTYEGYALGQLPDKLTMEEVKDYRSYLQTPVIRVKNIIESICRKENNAGKYDEGYDVICDPEFFNDNNPYYFNSFITLPSLNVVNNGGSGGTAYPIINTGSTFAGYSVRNGVVYSFPIITSSDGKARVQFNLGTTVPGATLDKLLLTYLQGPTFQTLKQNAAIAIQCYTSTIAGQNDNVLTHSDIQWLTNEIRVRGVKFRLTYDIAKDYTDVISPNSDVVDYDGTFVKQGSSYRWDKTIDINLDVPKNARYLKIYIQFVAANQDGTNMKLGDATGINEYTVPISSLQTNQITGSLTPIGEGISYSDSLISKKDLLSTSFSPADFLIAYCKQFGLYIWKDVSEDKIYIQTRNNFFKRDNIINLENLIDTSKDVSINPTYADSNYISLTNTGLESASYKDYLDKYNKVFGTKIVDTGYEFNADKKELVDSPFKNAVQTREKSIYFFDKYNGLNPYVFNGFSYSLYKDGDYEDESITVEVPKLEIAKWCTPLYSEKYYDVMGKPQFEDASHKSLDTAGVMLFFTGFQDVSSYDYFLTDDISNMSFINNKPCWLMTNSETDLAGNNIAKRLTTIPRFSRYYEGNHYMVYSWDFGSPRELYIPDFQNNDDVNIYSIYFKQYYADLYDINTKVLTCYLKDDVLNVEKLRNIYWFRNGYWRLNKIYDFNPSTPDTTKVDFIKIQDLDDLTNEEATTVRWIKITLDKYEIGQSGGTITGTVKTSDNYGWTIDGLTYNPTSPAPRELVTFSPVSGSQNGNFTLSVPSNIRDAREVTIKVYSDYVGQYVSGTTAFSQEGVEYQFSISPNSISGGTIQYTKDINITNPYYYDWSVTSKPEWVTASPSSIINGQTGTTGTTACTLTVGKNTTEVERTGVVVFTESTYGHTYSVNVLQKGYEFSISPSSLSYTKNGGNKTVTINNPYGYSWIVESKPDWITTAKTGGNLTVTANPNIVFQRTGTLVIKDTDFNKTYSVSITQESGYVFDIYPTSFSFDWNYDIQDTLTITNPNHMAWTITNIPSWLTVSPTAETGTSVSLTADVNIGFERTYSGITVNETLCDQHYYFDVQQDSGYYFKLLPTTGLSFTSGSTTKVMTIDCRDYNWKIISKPSWITTNYTTGYGATQVNVTASSNVGFARSGEIVVKNMDYNLEYTMNISQESGYVFNVSPTSFHFTSAGTAQQLTITNPNGYHWQIIDLPTWITVSPSTGNSNATVTVTAQVNGWDARSDIFSVYEDSIAYTETDINVSQDEGYTLSYSPTAFTFNVTSGSSTITINNPDNYNLQITSDKNWLSFSPTATTSSGQVTVNYTDNGSTSDDRTATITINNSSRSRSHTIGVRQAGYLFSVEPSSLTFASGGETTFIMIYDGNNIEWEITSYPSWLTPNVTTGSATRSVEFTAASNAGRPERTGTIVVKDKAFNIDYTVNVKQLSGYAFTVSPLSLSFIGAGESKTITITNTYGYNWAITTPNGWISVSQSTGNTTATVTVTAAANPSDARTGVLYVEETTYGGGAEVTLSQAEGDTLTYSPSSFSFNAASGSGILTINNPDNYSITVSSPDNWITVTANGNNYTVSVAANTNGGQTTNSRSGSVIITNNTRGKTYTVSVAQDGYEFSISPTAFTFDDIAQTKYLNITNPYHYSWASSNVPSWLTLGNSSDTAGTLTRISLTTSVNTGPERTKSGVTITDSIGIAHTFNVAQDSGYDFELLPTTGLTLTSAGTAQIMTVSCNGYRWEVTSKPNWVGLSVNSGIGTTQVYVSAGSNAGYERSGSIKVKDLDYNLEYTMNVTQSGGYSFSVSPTTFSFAATGGSATMTITNPNGYEWEITGLASWITASQTTGNTSATVTLTAAANSGENSRTDYFDVDENDYGGLFECTATQAGQTYLTPRIISITATEQDNPEPPTPTAATLTIINQMPYDTYGNWITSGPTISGDIHSGETRTYYWSSSSFPFTITGWGPGTVSGGSPMSWYIVNKTHSGSMTITYQGGYYQGTGSMTVYEGDELWLTT